MTNRIDFKHNEDLTIPLDDNPTIHNKRRGAKVSFPRDITAEEICKVLKSCGWWGVLFGNPVPPELEVEDFAFINTQKYDC